ncbi:glucosamine-6-phosphate deaminase [Lysinibacter sp. HNR]|uniref:glucosamine-6-phosphate deaminase n=1 Tax=Lysinibacter sp. HNR TaxID=3031408 RepID=UPI002435EC09|nr:glucosamine-6-phosphate deaminase [Lysinibacter sp. HNR]WGD38019.1 glucosamine-6-phosphate deaminase [Lysinibacter sp. HNR]
MAEVIIVKSLDEAGELAAQHITSLIQKKPDAVLGLATGSTPLPVYKALHRRVQQHGVDLSRVRGFALDEYVGISPDHPQSYRTVITNEVVTPLGLNPDLVQTPRGELAGIRNAGERYDADIRAAGGIDVQILGVGTSGHIGFNEPGSSLGSRTRVTTLTEQTRIDNARFFDSIDDVPTHSITQGVGTILEARHLILLAFGERKAEVLARCVEGPVSSSIPGSAIQLHPHVTVLVDEAAASQLVHADYYRRAFSNVPEWLAES